MADQICSITIVYSVLAALYHRAKTGEGQSVEIPMMDTMASFVLLMHGKDAVFEPPLGRRVTSALRARCAPPCRPRTVIYRLSCTPGKIGSTSSPPVASPMHEMTRDCRRP